MKLAELRSIVRLKTLRNDGMAGLVPGVESVPDGLASGLLAGVNPVEQWWSVLKHKDAPHEQTQSPSV
jgi:SulP family sulfate permease